MPSGLLAPLRVVVQRSLADWLIVAATWLVVLLAATLVAVGVLYGDAVALTGLRRILDEAPPIDRTIAVEMRAQRDEVGAVEAAAERQIGRILGWTGGELITIGRSDSYELSDGPSADVTDLAIFGAYERIDRHAQLSEGRWPEARAEPMQAAISRATADALGVSVGDELGLTSRRGSDVALSVAVAGIWEPTARGDPYWRAEPLELEGLTLGSSFATHGPFVVAWDDLLARAVTNGLTLEYRALPDFRRLAVDHVAWMRADAAALERRLAETLGDDAHFRVETRLDAILGDVGRSLLVSRSGVVVLTIQFAVLAGYALLLVAGLLIDQRRVETALLRSRGAGVAQVVLFSLLEALVLVIPAVLLAPWLAVATLGLLNVVGPLAEAGVLIEPRLDSTVLVATAIAGLAAVVGLVVPAFSAGRGLAAVRQTLSRQADRTLAQRLGIDVALVVLAGVGLWQLRQYGAPLTESVRGVVGLDPLLVAAPAIGLLAGAVIALRLVPLASAFLERLLVGRRGLVGPLGARQLARRPLRYTRSALLLMLAAALGTFAGAYGSTWTRSQVDQAAHRAAMDVRVTLSDFPDLPAWAIGSAYRSVDGVQRAFPVTVEEFDLDRTGGGVILGLDASATAEHLRFRADLGDAPLEELLARLPREDTAQGGLALAGEPTAIELDVTASLEALELDDSSETFSPGFRGVLPVVVVRDADGLVQRITGPRLGVGLGRQTAIIPMAGEGDVAAALPLTLLTAGVEVQLPEGTVGAGAVTIGGARVAARSGGLEALALELPEPISATADLPLGGLGSLPSATLQASAGAPGDPAAPVPVLASRRYLDLTGASVGETVDLGGLNERRPYEIVGSLEAFPTLGASEAFVVADLATLGTVAAADAAPLAASEWWLVTEAGAASSVAERLRQDPYSAASVLTFDDLRRDLLSDPIALGLIGSLVLGAVAAVAFAGIGFLVSAIVSTRERLGEFALLQAIGLSHRQLSAWLTLESVFLLLVGLLAGTGLGLVLAWVVLPFVSLTQDAAAPVPPVEIVIPWGAYAALYLVAGVALGLTVLAISSLLERVRVSGVLRSAAD